LEELGLENLVSQEDITFPIKYRKRGLESHITNHLPINLYVAIFLAAFAWLVQSINLDKLRSDRIVKLVGYLQMVFNYSIILMLLQMIESQLGIDIALNIKYFQFDNGFDLINTTVLMLIVIFYWLITSRGIYHVINHNINPNSYKFCQKYQKTFDDIKVDFKKLDGGVRRVFTWNDQLKMLWVFIRGILNISLSVCIIVFDGKAVIQYSSVGGILLLYLVLVLVVIKPYKKVLTLCTDAVFNGLLLLTLVAKGLGYLKVFNSPYFLWIQYIVFVLTILINIGLHLMSQLISLVVTVIAIRMWLK
jgi:hypothetical protein